jgi:hypothetical protein
VNPADSGRFRACQNRMADASGYATVSIESGPDLPHLTLIVAGTAKEPVARFSVPPTEIGLRVTPELRTPRCPPGGAFFYSGPRIRRACQAGNPPASPERTPSEPRASPGPDAGGGAGYKGRGPHEGRFLRRLCAGATAAAATISGRQAPTWDCASPPGT